MAKSPLTIGTPDPFGDPLRYYPPGLNPPFTWIEAKITASKKLSDLRYFIPHVISKITDPVTHRIMEQNKMYAKMHPTIEIPINPKKFENDITAAGKFGPGTYKPHWFPQPSDMNPFHLMSYFNQEHPIAGPINRVAVPVVLYYDYYAETGRQGWSLRVGGKTIRQYSVRGFKGAFDDWLIVQAAFQEARVAALPRCAKAE